MSPVAVPLIRNAVGHEIFTARSVAGLLKLTFVSGPYLLLTSRLSAKSASMMILLCAPALLLTAMLTIPALLFPSPQQQAYFYFAQMINQDPTRWVILAFAAVCSILALAVPATDSKSSMAARY